MSILLSSTLANESTPYYALAGSTISGDFIPAIPSNFTSLTAQWGASGAYPTTPAGGVVSGQTYTAPRTGAYLCEVAMGFNIGPEAVVAGTGDLVTTGIARTDTGFAISGSSTLQPINMPGTGGSDYSIRSSFPASLVAGGTYSLFWYVNNNSTTLDLGGASGACGLSILPLC